MLSSLSLGVKTKQYFVSSSDMFLNKKTFMIKRFGFFMRLEGSKQIMSKNRLLFL